MKIAYLSHLDLNLYLFRLSWMKALLKQGHEVCAILPRGEFFDRFAEHGIRAIEYPIDRGSLNPLSAVATIRQLRDILKRERFDLLHSFTIKPNIFGSISGRLAGVPRIINHVTGLGYIYTEHTAKARLLRLAASLLYRIAFNFAERVVFQNPDDLAALQGLFAPGKALIIKGTGVDTEHFSSSNVPDDVTGALRRELGLGSRDVVVTLIARLLWNKGVAEFLEAADTLSRRHADVRFLVVGWIDKGNPASVTEDFLMRFKSVPAISFLGERHDIRELLSVTDIYALPSYREGTPRTVLEAMAMGRPIVTSDAPGCRQTVEQGVNGFLTPVGNSKAFAEALERLLLDPLLRACMGRESRDKVVREFSDEVVIEQVMRLYC